MGAPSELLCNVRVAATPSTKPPQKESNWSCNVLGPLPVQTRWGCAAGHPSMRHSSPFAPPGPFRFAGSCFHGGLHHPSALGTRTKSSEGCCCGAALRATRGEVNPNVLSGSHEHNHLCVHMGMGMDEGRGRAWDGNAPVGPALLGRPLVRSSLVLTI